MNITTLPRRWTPVGLGGCMLWLDAMRSGSLYQNSTRTTPVTNDADPVGGWSDLSGSNNHATQSSATLRFSYSSTGLGTGYPGLISDGADDVLSTPSVTLPAATCFIVGKITTYKQYTGFLKLAATANETASNGVICYYSGISASYIGNPSTSWYRTGATSNIVNGSKVLFTQGWGSDFASIVIRKDRAAMTGASNAGTYAAPSGALPLHVGRGFSTTVSTATWGEVLVYSRQLAQSEIDAVEAYLRSKWGTP